VVARLMTMPGIDAIVAVSIVAAVGDFARFPSPDRPVSYMGLNPRVRQSGAAPASHGRITKAGRAHARGMLVEAAWSAARAPGPPRAFHRRINARRGFQVAMVATARKLTVLCWHLVTKNQDYAFARPGLNAHKRRSLDLAAGAKHTHGRRGPGFDYNHKQFRRSERDLVEQHERAYEVMITNWKPHRLDPGG
jgi:transposase